MFIGATAALAAAGCESRVGPSGSISVLVTPSIVTLAVGDTRQMSATVTGTTNQTVVWSLPFSSSEVLSVSSKGEIRCLAVGSGGVIAQSVFNPTANGLAVVTCEAPAR